MYPQSQTVNNRNVFRKDFLRNNRCIFIIIEGKNSKECFPCLTDLHTEAFLAKKWNSRNRKLTIFPDADHMVSRKEHDRKISESAVKWSKKHASEQTG
ncbi:MAG: hypothetical protein PVH55_07575 [Desulfobacterales bacterium]